MDSLLLGVRLLLAAVFATAGAGKLFDPAGSRRALEDFGVPARLAVLGRIALPVIELSVAAALVVRPSAQWGAVAAVALLVAFIAVIANALARGRAPDCHCFGQIHSEPAGASTLARNGALAVLAVLVAARGPGPSVDAWLAARSTSDLAVLLTAAAAIGAGTFVVRSWTQRRTLERLQAAAKRPAGLPIGARAPQFALRSLHGEIVTLDSLLDRNTPLVLVFTHPGCGPCRELFPEIGRWQATLAGPLTIVVVTQGTLGDNVALSEPHGLVDVLVQQRSEVYEAYEMRATPSAVAVAPDGTIASVTADGGLTVEALIRLTLRRAAAMTSVAAAR
jgi:uncharacterized membrane protein YphA (DoxX/SURF4 family)/thiol-disulfide isomerase/thioredoxin